jgi:hypothetical protein
MDKYEAMSSVIHNYKTGQCKEQSCNLPWNHTVVHFAKLVFTSYASNIDQYRKDECQKPSKKGTGKS